MGEHPERNETREMRLFSRVIEMSEKVPDRSLPEFIARRRVPGTGWRTWDELRYELRDVTGEIVTDGSMRTWAKRYGIPEGTASDSDKGVRLAFTRALRAAGIEIS